MSKLTNIKFIAVYSVILSLAGCMTLGSVEIEIIKPAKIDIPTNVNSLLVLNNSLIHYADSFKHEIQKGLFNLDTTTTQLLCGQINAIFNESPRFNKSILIEDIYYRDPMDMLQAINWTSVNQLCEKYQVDALVSLEAFGIVDTIVRISEFDGFGYISYTNLVLITNSLWRIYLPENQQILEKRIQRDTIYINDFSSKREYLKAITQDNVVNYLATTLANNISIKVADRVAPYWQPVTRYFYIYGSGDMQKAASFAYADNWRDAAIIWKTFTDNENKRIAAAACHNMALVCEVEGKLDIAEQWLLESLETYSTTITVDYLNQIISRKKESTKLDKQFGIK